MNAEAQPELKKILQLLLRHNKFGDVRRGVKVGDAVISIDGTACGELDYDGVLGLLQAVCGVLLVLVPLIIRHASRRVFLLRHRRPPLPHSATQSLTVSCRPWIQ